jgi:hypothetical protein
MKFDQFFYRIVFLLLLIIPGAVYAATWHQYAENNLFIFLYDSDDVRHPESILKIAGIQILSHPGYRRVWVKQIAKDDEGKAYYLRQQTKRGYSIEGYDTYRYTIFLKDIDCSEKRIRIVAEADYNDKGILLDSMAHDVQYLRWSVVIADSDDDRLIRAVCTSKSSDRQPPVQNRAETPQGADNATSGQSLPKDSQQGHPVTEKFFPPEL